MPAFHPTVKTVGFPGFHLVKLTHELLQLPQNLYNFNKIGKSLLEVQIIGYVDCYNIDRAKKVQNEIDTRNNGGNL